FAVLVSSTFGLPGANAGPSLPEWSFITLNVLATWSKWISIPSPCASAIRSSSVRRSRQTIGAATTQPKLYVTRSPTFTVVVSGVREAVPTEEPGNSGIGATDGGGAGVSVGKLGSGAPTGAPTVIGVPM